MRGSARSGGIELARRASMAALRPLERGLLARAEPLPPSPPCFIVGPPRSGTTLLYQVLVRGFRFAYISNLAHRLPETPAAATLLGRPLLRRWAGAFSSRYGHVAGWGAPNEGGRVWGRWLPEPEPQGAELAERLPRDEIRRTVSALSGVLDAPFLNKNVMHSVRIPLLDALFPGCGFLELRRDPARNVRSILGARRAGGGTIRDGWWSVKPRAWRRFAEADVALQAAAQVRLVRSDVERGVAALAPGRHLAVDYEALCEDPRGTARRIADFLRELGSEPELRHELPARFELARGEPPTAEPETDAVLRAVERVWSLPEEG